MAAGAAVWGVRERPRVSARGFCRTHGQPDAHFACRSRADVSFPSCYAVALLAAGLSPSVLPLPSRGLCPPLSHSLPPVLWDLRSAAPMALGLFLPRAEHTLSSRSTSRDRPVRLLVAVLAAVAFSLAAVVLPAGFVSSGGRLVSARSVAWGGGVRLRVAAPAVAAPLADAAATEAATAAAATAAAAAVGVAGPGRGGAPGKPTGASEDGGGAAAAVDEPATPHADAGTEGGLAGGAAAAAGGASKAAAATEAADPADGPADAQEAPAAATAASAPSPDAAAPDLPVTETVGDGAPPGVPPAGDAASSSEGDVDAAVAAAADSSPAAALPMATTPAASAEPVPRPHPGGDPNYPPYSVRGAPPVTVLATPPDPAIPAGRGRIALLFLTTGNLAFEGLWREWLGPAGDRAVIRVHCDHAGADVTSEWLNAHRTADTVATEWGRPSLTAAMRMLLVDAAAADTPERPIVKYVFLCGRSVPIQTFGYVYAALTADGDNWMSRQVPDRHLLSLPKSLQWMILNRPSVAAVVDPRRASAVAALVAAGKLEWNVETDEFFAAAVVGQAGLMTAAANRSAMWSVWDRGASSPRVHHDMGDSEVASLRAAKVAGVLWARKFSHSSDVVTELGLHRDGEPFTPRTLYPFTNNFDVVERYGLGADGFGGRVEDRQRTAVWTPEEGWRRGR